MNKDKIIIYMFYYYYEKSYYYISQINKPHMENYPFPSSSLFIGHSKKIYLENHIL